jgi:hypothetical protein
MTQGDIVQRSGALWLCKDVTTTATPGNGASAWKLVVKAARDGRSAFDIARQRKLTNASDEIAWTANCGVAFARHQRAGGITQMTDADIFAYVA